MNLCRINHGVILSSCSEVRTWDWDYNVRHSSMATSDVIFRRQDDQLLNVAAIPRSKVIIAGSVGGACLICTTGLVFCLLVCRRWIHDKRSYVTLSFVIINDRLNIVKQRDFVGRVATALNKWAMVTWLSEYFSFLKLEFCGFPTTPTLFQSVERWSQFTKVTGGLTALV